MPLKNPAPVQCIHCERPHLGLSSGKSGETEADLDTKIPESTVFYVEVSRDRQEYYTR